MRRAAGFTFIEVLIALSILVVGSVSILALFTLGVDAQIRRRVDARQAQVRPEIEALLQAAVDGTKPGGAPAVLRAQPLSVPGYALDVDWAMDEGPSRTPIAFPFLLYRGQRVRALGPHPVQRTLLDPSK
jgi:prepilin-type N-terminal cleavage/methylation domain-containing protein